MKKETWLTKLLQKKFPNQPELQFRLNNLFIPIIHIFGGLILPLMSTTFFLIAPLVFVMLFPLSVYCLTMLILSFLIKIEDIEFYISKYGGYIIGGAYVLFVIYLSSTLSNEMAGGFVYELYLELVGNRIFD